jgi:hypothetical protein
MIALLGATADPCLPHEDEAGEEQRLERDQRAQQGKRRWVDVRDGADGRRVGDDPMSPTIIRDQWLALN